VFLSILTLTYIALYRVFILPFHPCHLNAPFILALPHTFPIVRLPFLSSRFPAKILSSFTSRGLLPKRFLLPSPLSIHYPFIALDFITTFDFSSVYICMETFGSFGRMPPTAARFMTFHFLSRFAYAHGYMRVTPRFTVGRDASASVVPSYLLDKLVCMQDMHTHFFRRRFGGGTVTYYFLGRRLPLCLLHSIYCKS